MGKTAFTRGLPSGLGVAGRRFQPHLCARPRVRAAGCRFTILICTVSIRGTISIPPAFSIISEHGGVLVIEWSENIEGALPEDAVRVTLSRGETENQRVFLFEGLPGAEDAPVFPG